MRGGAPAPLETSLLLPPLAIRTAIFVPVKKFFGRKFLLAEKMIKNVRLEKLFCQKKLAGSVFFVGRKQFGRKKKCSKNVLVEKLFGRKKLRLKNFLAENMFSRKQNRPNRFSDKQFASRNSTGEISHRGRMKYYSEGSVNSLAREVNVNRETI